MTSRTKFATPLKDQELIYSDFLTDFNTHPITGDLSRLPNERAVISAMRNLILTDVGERVYQPEIGSKLRTFLFGNLTEGIESAIESQVAELLGVFEPRARVTNVRAVADEEENGFRLTITFYVINRSDPISFNVTLSRVR